MTIALPLAGAALVPDEAEACGADPCLGADQWVSLQPLNAASIPIDGVLLLQGVQTGDSPDADWLARVDLTVTRDGQPIAGAIETSAVDDVLVWRPAAPLAPGATYKVTGSLDNPDDDPYSYCADDMLLLDFEFQADVGPLAPLVPPKTSAEESVLQAPQEDLADLVCCDGAMPQEVYYGDCSGDFEVVWGEGFCTTQRGFGTLHVELAVESGLPAMTDAMVVRQIFVDGQASYRYFFGIAPVNGSTPFCTAVLLTNLATGETVMSEEQCHGAAVADQLGEQAIDPGPALEQNCSGEPYVCAVDPQLGKWDETQCTPWPGAAATTGDPTGGPTSGEPGTGGTGETGATGTDSGAQDGLVDHGCACDGGGGGPLGLLGLLALGLLRPRRGGRGRSRSG